MDGGIYLDLVNDGWHHLITYINLIGLNCYGDRGPGLPH